MSIIYEPKGKAREYSPKALNVYLTCTHGCRYCYAPRCRHQSDEQYFVAPMPRPGIAEKLEMEIKKGGRPKEQVLLSFIGDIYCESRDEGRAGRRCLEILLENKIPVAILTKGGKRCLNDIELFKEFGEHIQVGATLTFDNEKDSLEWEPGASVPQERIEVLGELRENGIKTFASFEPVIRPEQSLNLMRMTLPYVDVYKVGKLNNYKGIDKTIDWTAFLKGSLEILRPAGKAIYIKHDLRQSAPSVRLYGNEVLPDEHCVR